MADLTITLTTLGAPLGQLTLGAAAKEVIAVLAGSVNGLVEFAAFDGDGAAVSFLYSDSATGTFNRIQSGVARLPMVNGQSWYFKQDQTAAPQLQANRVG